MPILVVVASLVVEGCAQQPPPFDAAAAAEALLKQDREWSTVASEGKDIDKIVSYWADDAIVIPSGQPIAEGKAAIRAFVVASLAVPGFKIHWTSEKPVFSPDGRLAYMRGTNEVTFTGENGPVTMHARALTVWRHDSDGQWRCVADTWNDEPAPPATKG
jgi:ketosteroid isomerase-like protein